MKNYLLIVFGSFIVCGTSWAELFLGVKEIDPGISLTFEVAAKDHILPSSFYLSQKDTDVHVEMLAVWNESAPAGSVVGGFVAYLKVAGELKNQKTGQILDFELTPHINLSDNLHYAQNIKLPGLPEDPYRLKFRVSPPEQGSLGMHLDWVVDFGEDLIRSHEIEFTNLDLSEIALSTRN